MNVAAHDPYPNEVILGRGIPYVSLAELFARSDVITLHCPLTPETCRLIDDGTIAQMRRKCADSMRMTIISTPNSVRTVLDSSVDDSCAACGEVRVSMFDGVWFRTSSRPWGAGVDNLMPRVHKPNS